MNSLPIVESMHIFKKDSSGSFIILKDRHWIYTFLFEGSVKRFHWCIIVWTPLTAVRVADM